jgi:hypothetical protein
VTLTGSTLFASAIIGMLSIVAVVWQSEAKPQAQHASSALNPRTYTAQSKMEGLTGIKRSETQVREFLKKNSVCVVAASA